MRDSSSDHRSQRRGKRQLSADEKLLLDRLKEAGLEPQDEDTERPHERRERLRRREIADERERPSKNRPAGFGCYRLLRWATRLTAWSYLLLVGGLVYAMHMWGQANVTSAALMYLPPLMWVVPGIALLLPVLVFDWKSFPFLLAAVVLFFTWHLGFKLPMDNPRPKAKGFELVRVLTWNRGQGKKASLSQLKNELKPDFVLLQDAKISHYLNNPDYGEFREIRGLGEFVVMSRWPMLALTEIRGPSKGRYSAGQMTAWGVRAVVLAAGQRCSIYCLHLPTPRDTLESYKGGAFLWGVLGIPGTPWEAKKLQYQAYWDDYLAFSDMLVERLKNEIGPVIVAGDMNTPAMGPIHNGLTSLLQDAHLAAGSGFGYTFPGDTRNPLALAQPWLRLDQIHASQHWEVLRCSVHEMPSQHWPVFAELRMRPVEIPGFPPPSGDLSEPPMAPPQPPAPDGGMPASLPIPQAVPVPE